MAVGATDYVVFGIGLPMVKRLFHEEVYPFLSGKVHSWLNPSKTKATIKQLNYSKPRWKTQTSST